MVKITWILIILNTSALILFVSAYFVMNAGREVDYQEKGWTAILSVAGFLLVLLAALPLSFCKGKAAIVFSFVVAAVPSFLAACMIISNLVDF